MLKLPQSSFDRKHFIIVGILVLLGTVALGFFPVSYTQLDVYKRQPNFPTRSATELPHSRRR